MNITPTERRKIAAVRPFVRTLNENEDAKRAIYSKVTSWLPGMVTFERVCRRNALKDTQAPGPYSGDFRRMYSELMRDDEIGVWMLDEPQRREAIKYLAGWDSDNVEDGADNDNANGDTKNKNYPARIEKFVAWYSGKLIDPEDADKKRPHPLCPTQKERDAWLSPQTLVRHFRSRVMEDLPKPDRRNPKEREEEDNNTHNLNMAQAAKDETERVREEMAAEAPNTPDTMAVFINSWEREALFDALYHHDYPLLEWLIQRTVTQLIDDDHEPRIRELRVLLQRLSQVRERETAS